MARTSMVPGQPARCRALAETFVLGRSPTPPTPPDGSEELAQIGELGARIIDALETVDHVARLGARKRKELESSAAANRAWDEARRCGAMEVLTLFFERGCASQGAVTLASSLLDVPAPAPGQRTLQVQTACERLLAERYPLPPFDRVAGLVRMAVSLSVAERGAKGKVEAADPTELANALAGVSRIERDWALTLGAAVHQQLQLKISRRVPRAAKSAEAWLQLRYSTGIKRIARQLADELRLHV